MFTGCLLINTCQGRIQGFEKGGGVKDLKEGGLHGCSPRKNWLKRKKTLLGQKIGGGGRTPLTLPPWIRTCIQDNILYNCTVKTMDRDTMHGVD